MARTYTGEFEISYYEIDARCKIVWDSTLDTERVAGSNEALESAKAWLNGDEARDIRTVMADADTVYMYGSPKGDPHEDVVAVIERYYVDHAGVENV